MDQILSPFERFGPTIRNIVGSEPLSSPSLRETLTLDRDGPIEVIYAPFEHIPLHASVVIVGITPGMVQANNALVAARDALRKSLTSDEVLRHAKLTASFSGIQMRNSLVSMMDAIGLAQLLGVPSTGTLFSAAGEKVHFTSALRYPVFINRQNYNGTPDMIGTPILRKMIESHLAEEARALPNAVWIPLGPKPTLALNHLASLGILSRDQILNGMPHPSGANGERIACFLGRKAASAVSSRTNPEKIAIARRSLEAQVQTLMGKGVSA